MEKISPQQAVANYMWTKSSFLPHRKRKYMTKEIEKDILTWSEEESIKIIKDIIDVFLVEKKKKHDPYTHLYSSILLTAPLCPYCYKNGTAPFDRVPCDNCFYGKTRGVCGDRASVWWDYRYSAPYEVKEIIYDKLIQTLQKGINK